MKRIGILILGLWVCLISTGLAQAPRFPHQFNPKFPLRFPRELRLPNTPEFPALSQHNLQSAVVSRLPASASKDVNWSPCTQQEAIDLGGMCGTLDVPLDRKHPKKEQIAIYFELYRGASDPAESAILANFGGPGGTTTGLRSAVLWIFGANLDKHDILLIDDRGRGQSGALDCPDLQHGTKPWAEAVAGCVAQLGDAASRYGTGDVAMDTEAVRAALGYDKVDYYGGSYGGADVSAYATRFGEHLRSAILDASFGAPSINPFLYAHSRMAANSRMVSLSCLRSPTCSADHPNPAAELDALVWRIRAHPLEGDAHDASGNLVHVRIDEVALLDYLIGNVWGNFTNTGELLAAAASMWRGDPQPLLRLGAEGYFPMERDSGDPSWFSQAIYVGTSAVDGPEPWDWSAPAPIREQQYAEAIAALPPLFFAPFSRRIMTDVMFTWVQNSGQYLLWWEVPTPPSPIEPPHPKYPQVPTLALSGDMDNVVPTEEASKVAALFHGKPLIVPGSGHETVWYSQCARDLASQFIETLEAGDTSCLATPEIVWPAVGRFPLFARDARPAEVDPDGGNQIGVGERKVATVAVATVIDAWNRLLMGSGGTGVGLRGGSFTADWTGQMTLKNCSFTRDVKVNGTSLWPWDNSFTADLTGERTRDFRRYALC